MDLMAELHPDVLHRTFVARRSYLATKRIKNAFRTVTCLLQFRFRSISYNLLVFFWEILLHFSHY